MQRGWGPSDGLALHWRHNRDPVRRRVFQAIDERARRTDHSPILAGPTVVTRACVDAATESQSGSVRTIGGECGDTAGPA